MSIERPDIVEDAHLEFLDKLRESGKTNMFGAVGYLRWDDCGADLSEADARKVLAYWMESFSERHNG